MLEVGINSFLTVEEADIIVQEELLTASSESKLWSLLSSNDKEVILKQGTRDINSLNFKGTRANGSKLKFPRYINGVNVGIPYEVKVATVVNALMNNILKDSEQYNLMKLGVTSMSVGGNSVSLDRNTINNTRVQKDAKEYIQQYLLSNIKI